MSNKNNTSSKGDAIDQQLKRAFTDLANEPLPDRFSKLLDDLRASETTAANNTPGENAEGDQ